EHAAGEGHLRSRRGKTGTARAPARPPRRPRGKRMAAARLRLLHRSRFHRADPSVLRPRTSVAQRAPRRLQRSEQTADRAFARGVRRWRRKGVSGERMVWIAADPATQRVAELARKVAETSTIVLITGESGTGKDQLARLIHELSPRRDAPYLKIDCA